VTPNALAPVTLVIPVRDEAASIDALATSIAVQVIAPASGVFVDGGSLDCTPELLRGWAAARPSWTVIDAGPATPGRGRNVGIEAATTEWVALTDAGMVLDQYWLARLVEAAAGAPGAEVVFGHRDLSTRGFWGRSSELAYETPLRWSERGPVRDRSFANCLLRRDAWERAGRFPDLRAAEDGIFLRRLEGAGVYPVVAPEARIVGVLEPTMRATFRRLRLYSRVNVEAGEQARWHYGVARQWLVAAPFLIAGVRRRRLLAIPALAFAARAAKSIAARREGRALSFVANPVRLAGVGAVLLTSDVATFAGWFDAVRDRRRARAVRG
jgi:cellulose synthase/poly-beta-1,6-N-acetylglucosamine synthase-like glycosyltransferase